MAEPGRDQRAPMQRLLLLVARMRAAGTTGATAEQLIEAAGIAGAPEVRRRKLYRELAHLLEVGVVVENLGAEGTIGRYVLVGGDTRLRVRLRADQRAALLRAAMIAGRGDLAQDLEPRAGAAEPIRSVLFTESAPPVALEQVLRAAVHHSLVRFRYNGRTRIVHPYAVRVEEAEWRLVGRLAGAPRTRVFAVARMREVAIDDPGTADPPPPDAQVISTDPLSWQVDPPLTAVLRTRAQHVPDVEQLLGAVRVLGEVGAGPAEDGEVELELTVTNRLAFRARLFELGSRVRLVGCEELRADVRAALYEVLER